MSVSPSRFLPGLVVASLTLGACDQSPTASKKTPLAARASVAARGADSPTMALLGEKIFNDVSLSLNKNQSCASCHDAAWGFSGPNPTINANGAVMPGSIPTRFAIRKPPSAAYAAQSPVMFTDEEGTILGGNFWDGRATGARLGIPSAEQALLPFLGAEEQGLPDAACVIFRVTKSNYSGLARSVFGNAVFGIKFPANTDQLCSHEGNTVPLSAADRTTLLAAYDQLGLSVAAFEASPAVSQFDSKYDAYLEGKASLTTLELDGLALYEGKAQCNLCHPSEGKKALFTDFSFDNIGVPANPKNPALLSYGFTDLGLGAFVGDPSLHGAQKVPTLRNIDKRGVPGGAKSYMHNGAFKTLEEVVHFYNTRDVLPGCPSVASPVPSVNCWPAPEVNANVNVDELGNLGLTPQEEAAVVAYLRTLSDGYLRGKSAR
jgi:cytochrome c peroxidase